MVKVKIGAITKEVPEGSLKWYLEAGWSIVKGKGKNETDTKANVTEPSNVPEV